MEKQVRHLLNSWEVLVMMISVSYCTKHHHVACHHWDHVLQGTSSSGEQTIRAAAAQGAGDGRDVSTDHVERRPNGLHKASTKPVPNLAKETKNKKGTSRLWNW